ncbi:MAG TPA: hypothetical protein VF699_01775 [Caulobacteraceae bacterium]|jgi:hypothetical protein
MKIVIGAAAFTAAAIGFAVSAAAETQAPAAAPAQQQPAAVSAQRAPTAAPAMQHAPGMSHQEMMQGKGAPSAQASGCGCPCCKGMMQQGAAKAS